MVIFPSYLTLYDVGSWYSVLNNLRIHKDEGGSVTYLRNVVTTYKTTTNLMSSLFSEFLYHRRHDGFLCAIAVHRWTALLPLKQRERHTELSFLKNVNGPHTLWLQMSDPRSLLLFDTNYHYSSHVKRVTLLSQLRKQKVKKQIGLSSDCWDIRFPRLCVWRWLSFGLLLRVVRYEFTDVSEVFSASIIMSTKFSACVRFKWKQFLPLSDYVLIYLDYLFHYQLQ
jgi:hypothetical protein